MVQIASSQLSMRQSVNRFRWMPGLSIHTEQCCNWELSCVVRVWNPPSNLGILFVHREPCQPPGLRPVLERAGQLASHRRTESSPLTSLHTPTPSRHPPFASIWLRPSHTLKLCSVNKRTWLIFQQVPFLWRVSLHLLARFFWRN